MAPRAMMLLRAAAGVAVLALAMPAAAHDHQANVIPDGKTTTEEPLVCGGRREAGRGECEPC